MQPVARSALIELADLNLLLALRRFEEDQLRAAPGSVPARFLQAEHVPVEVDRFLQILHPIASVQEFLYHGGNYLARLRRKFKRKSGLILEGRR